MQKTKLKRRSNVFMALLLLLTLTVSGCKTDLTDVYKRLDEQDQRLKTLESIAKKSNEELLKLNELVKAVEGKIQIVSYSQLKDNSGYELIMSDGSKMILKNGSKGDAPVVGVKSDADGLLYWTINGEFMLNPNGEKISAKGEIGITPKLRVNTNNEWEFSEDGGKTWQMLLDVAGKPIIAVGKDGKNSTENLKIEETKETVIITYNGSTFIIPKASTLSTVIKHPIEYVAEYNVNVTGDGFTNNYLNASSGYFNWYEAMGEMNAEYNPNSKNIFDQPVFKGKYHLPTMEEWRIVLPDELIDWVPPVQNQLNVEENISVAGITKTYTADYNLRKGSGRCYAIRFKGDGEKYRAAYRYLYTKNSYDTKDEKQKMLTVTVRYLGPENTSVTLNQVSDDAFWNDSKATYITRIFPATGYQVPDKSLVHRVGEQGFHWSATQQKAPWNEKNAISMNFYDIHIDLTFNAYNKKYDRYAIRPFRNH